MIIIHRRGRLGNHLFQYAFALELSKRYKTLFLFYGVPSKFNEYFYPIFFLDRPLFKKIMNRLVPYLPLKKISQYDFQPNKEIIDKIQNFAIYDGYFQSPVFFPKVSEVELRAKFRIRKKFTEAFNEKYGDLFSNHKTIVIHIRLGDYLNWGNDSLGGKNLSLPPSYYQNALKTMNTAGYKIIAVTDDLKNFQQLSIECDQVISDTIMNDFQALLHADKLIISNSTFSWWAAFLNSKKEEVFCPEYFVGFKIKKEFPESIYPKEFKQIPVY